MLSKGRVHVHVGNSIGPSRLEVRLSEPRNRFPAWRAGSPGYRLAESIPRKRFLGSLKVYKYGLSGQMASLPVANMSPAGLLYNTLIF